MPQGYVYCAVIERAFTRRGELPIDRASVRQEERSIPKTRRSRPTQARSLEAPGAERAPLRSMEGGSRSFFTAPLVGAWSPWEIFGRRSSPRRPEEHGTARLKAEQHGSSHGLCRPSGVRTRAHAPRRRHLHDLRGHQRDPAPGDRPHPLGHADPLGQRYSKTRIDDLAKRRPPGLTGGRLACV